MADHIESTNLTFNGPRTDLVWPSPPNTHLELSSTQVPLERAYNAANLVTLWRFNETSGSTVNDTTGSATNVVANNGTVYADGNNAYIEPSVD